MLLVVVGIPYAALLTAFDFILSLVQLSPVPVLLPVVFRAYWKGEEGWATVLLVWIFPTIMLDHLLRPVLIKKSANVSLLIIFPGVIGGLIAFGLIGIFIGPTVLAVTLTLLAAWAMAASRKTLEDTPCGLNADA